MKDRDPYGMREKPMEELLRTTCGRSSDSLDHQYALAEIRRRERMPSDRRERIIIGLSAATLIVAVEIGRAHV